MLATDLWPDLLGCLDLSGTAPGVFEGRNQELSYHRLFGGQLLAQFTRAATLACPGKPAGVIATAAVSLHASEEGPSHQAIAPVTSVPGEKYAVGLDLIPWETRSVTNLDSPGAGPPELELWMRTPPADPELATALTAYATDLTLIGTALRPLENVSQRDAGTAFTSGVTSHTIWFHRSFRTDGWLLLRQHSPLLAHGRSFGRGDVLTEDGSLVASYAQEAMVRFRA